MPIVTRIKSGIIGTNIAISNHGAPIDIFPILNTSRTNGASVPKRIKIVAITSKTLFKSKKVSLDTAPKPTFLSRSLAFFI